MILRFEHTIKIDNQTYRLTISSGSESGLKIKVNKKLSTSLDKLVAAFDARLSIHKTDNNNYKLKPVLKLE
jgi:hypothetical protein